MMRPPAFPWQVARLHRKCDTGAAGSNSHTGTSHCVGQQHTTLLRQRSLCVSCQGPAWMVIGGLQGPAALCHTLLKNAAMRQSTAAAMLVRARWTDGDMMLQHDAHTRVSCRPCSNAATTLCVTYLPTYAHLSRQHCSGQVLQMPARSRRCRTPGVRVSLSP
jgi:hypothetical protein